MSDLKLNTLPAEGELNDLTITNNELVIIVDGPEIVQRVRERLNTFLGEWFLDSSVGVAYFQSILVKNPNSDIIQAIFKREITQTPGIIELTEYDQVLDLQTRILKITWQARSDVGVLNSEILLEAA